MAACRTIGYRHLDVLITTSGAAATFLFVEMLFVFEIASVVAGVSGCVGRRVAVVGVAVVDSSVFSSSPLSTPSSSSLPLLLLPLLMGVVWFEEDDCFLDGLLFPLVNLVVCGVEPTVDVGCCWED